jgi:hypothetical protein
MQIESSDDLEKRKWEKRLRKYTKIIRCRFIVWRRLMTAFEFLSSLFSLFLWLTVGVFVGGDVSSFFWRDFDALQYLGGFQRTTDKPTTKRIG